MFLDIKSSKLSDTSLTSGKRLVLIMCYLKKLSNILRLLSMESSKDAVTERSSSSLRRAKKKLLVNNEKIGETEVFNSSLCAWGKNWLLNLIVGNNLRLVSQKAFYILKLNWLYSQSQT